MWSVTLSMEEYDHCSQKNLAFLPGNLYGAHSYTVVAALKRIFVAADNPTRVARNPRRHIAQDAV